MRYWPMSVRITRSMVHLSLSDYVGWWVRIKVDLRSVVSPHCDLSIIRKVSCRFSWKSTRLAWLSSWDSFFARRWLSIVCLHYYSSCSWVIGQTLGCWRLALGTSFLILVDFNYMFEISVAIWKSLAEELLTMRAISLGHVILLKVRLSSWWRLIRIL